MWGKWFRTSSKTSKTSKTQVNRASIGGCGRTGSSAVHPPSAFATVFKSFSLRRGVARAKRVDRTSKSFCEIYAAQITLAKSSPPLDIAILSASPSASLKRRSQPNDDVQNERTTTSDDSNSAELATNSSGSGGGGYGDNILDPCTICGRTFRPASLAKHISICEKMTKKKRNIFDSSRQRCDSAELAAFIPKTVGIPTVAKQQQHTTEVRATVVKPLAVVRKFSRSGTPESSHSLSASGPTPTAIGHRRALKRDLKPINEHCPHCERNFGVKAYDRHVEWCREKSRLANTHAGGTTAAAVHAAKERLEARTKYKAPCMKTRRGQNRDKYAGLAGSDSMNSLIEYGIGMTASMEERHPMMTHSMTSSMTSESSPREADKYFSMDEKDGADELNGGDLWNDSATDLSFVLPNNNRIPFTQNQNEFAREMQPQDFDELLARPASQIRHRKMQSCHNRSCVAAPAPASAKLVDRVALEKAKLSMTAVEILNFVSNGFSDKYDPFVSAKRQLDELFSPTSSPNAASTPHKSLALSTKSSTLYAPTAASSNKERAPFRRTSSLRVPKKTVSTRSLFPTCAARQRPTIQRGLSDEGPISTKFVKPEEFDEIPVKAALTGGSCSPPSQQPFPSIFPKSPAGVVMRDSSAASNANRRALRLEIHRCNQPEQQLQQQQQQQSQMNPISKTDSLAAFLKYEHDFAITEKDIKDKTNSLSKRADSSSVLNLLPPQRHAQIKLAALDHRIASAKTAPMPDDDQSVVDPKLINLFDNLHVDKLADWSTSSYRAKEAPCEDSNREMVPAPNGERKSLLKRQIKLDKSSILFDTVPTKDDETLTLTPTAFAAAAATAAPHNENPGDVPPNALPPLKCDRDRDVHATIFDDFDFEEFISSFEDDEQDSSFADNVAVPPPDSGRQSPTTNASPSPSRPSQFEEFTPTERELLQSVHELNEMCGGQHADEIAGDGKASVDSAYRSLSRQSPQQMLLLRPLVVRGRHQNFTSASEMLGTASTKRMPLFTDQRSPSSPSSPPQPSHNNSDSESSSIADAVLQRPSKFCHECGNRFLVEHAKFCMECGVKRVLIG